MKKEKLKFVSAPDDMEKTGLCRRMVSEDGKIEIGLYTVMYGFRIRAGYVGNDWCELDYCAGANVFYVSAVYNFVLFALMNKIPFEKFPKQNIKPMDKDEKCFRKLTEMCGALTDFTPEIFTADELSRMHKANVYYHFYSQEKE